MAALATSHQILVQIEAKIHELKVKHSFSDIADEGPNSYDLDVVEDYGRYRELIDLKWLVMNPLHIYGARPEVSSG